jgi:hypothetical protein
MSKKIVLVNQDSGYMTIDLVNAFADTYDEVVLMAGNIVCMHTDINHKVKICNIARYNRKNSFTRASSWILSTIQVLFFLTSSYRKHELFFTTNPPTLIFNLLFLKRPFSLLVWDLYPDALIMGKFIKSERPLFIIWSWVNKKVLPQAAVIITLTKSMAKRLSHYVSGDFVHIVPAWSSGFILPDYTNAPNPFIQKYQLEGKFIILYSGNLGKEHEVEALVYLAEKLKDKTDIIILIAGTGWKFETLNREIKIKQLINCRLLPKQPVELFQASLAATNLGVVSLMKSAADVSIPSKTYNLLAAGKPILCIGDENSDLAVLLNNTKSGAAFSSGKLDEMTAFVLSLQQNPEVYSKYCKNASVVSGEFTAANAHKIARMHQEATRV